MDINRYFDFLQGNNLSTDLQVKYLKQNSIIEKLDYIKALVTNKKIIDLGFADHYESIDTRINNGNWVHQSLRNWSDKILGIDINEKAVNYIKEKFKYDNIYCYDITNDEKLNPIIESKWDYLVMSEILEHVPDPSFMLKKIKENYSGSIDKLIITVPNAYGLIILRSVLKNTERINSDHKYWFTPYTLSKVAISAGLEVESIVMANSYYPLRLWERIITKRIPLMHQTIILVAKL